MKDVNTRTVVESGLLTALMIVFAVIGLSVPFLGFFGSILVPTTVAITGVRHGFKWSFLSVISAVIVIALFLGPLTALMEGAVFGSMGIVIGWGLRKQWAVSKLLLIPAAIIMIALIVQFWAYGLMTNVDMASMAQNMQQEITHMMEDVYVSQGLDTAQVNEAMVRLEQQIELAKNVLFAGLYISGISIAYLINILAYTLLKRTGTQGITEIPTISKWYIPDWALHIFLVGVICYFTYQYLPILEYVGYNLMYLGGIMLFIRGISLAWRITKSYNPPKFLPWLVLGVFFMMAQSGAILGALDVFFHFESRWKKPNP